METSVAVPWPAATMEPAFEPTVMPEIEPVEIEPLLVETVIPDIVPDPVLLSSGAVTEPLLRPMETLVIVPWPAATMEPALEPAVIPPIDPAEIEPPVVAAVIPDMVPEPAVLATGAVTVPPFRPMDAFVIVPWPAATMEP